MDVDYCMDCLEEFAVGTLVDDRCPDCADRHNEGAYERQCEAFYGVQVVCFAVKSDNPKAPAWRVMRSVKREDRVTSSATAEAMAGPDDWN